LEEASSHAPAGAGISDVSASNCLVTLANVDSLATMTERLPAFGMNWRWDVGPVPVSIPTRFAYIQCLGGDSLKIICLLHKGSDGDTSVCKAHIRLRGRYEAAQCLLLRWAVAGTSLSMTDHIDAAKQLQRNWAARSW
jgi:hypothetical protein